MKFLEWLWHTPSKTSPHPWCTRQKLFRGHVTLSYVDVIIKALSQKMLKHAVTTHATFLDTIRRRLTSPKTMTPSLTSAGVKYLDCEKHYIGETEHHSGIGWLNISLIPSETHRSQPCKDETLRQRHTLIPTCSKGDLHQVSHSLLELWSRTPSSPKKLLSHYHPGPSGSKDIRNTCDHVTVKWTRAAVAGQKLWLSLAVSTD